MTNTSEPITNLTPDLQRATAAFQTFVDACDKTGRTAAIHDSDADGVTAGVVWQRAFERMGFQHVVRVIPDRERNAWTSANQERLKEAQPDNLFVMDLGSQERKVLPGVPTCFIDHHRPEGCPPGDTLISAYTWAPIPNTSLLIYDLSSAIVDVSDLDWVAAIGTMSDLGERAPFPLLETAKKKYTAKYLKEATALVNAARRASVYDPEAAARALLAHDSPRAMCNSDAPEVAFLRAAREEVKGAIDEGRKAAPTFAGRVALVRLDSPCQIHPLIAQSWRTRLPKYIVIAANEGYLPGRVNFSVRATDGYNVLAFLRGFDIGEGEGHFGHGHDQASGGSLPVERWNRLLTQMGFPPSVYAHER